MTTIDSAILGLIDSFFSKMMIEKKVEKKVEEKYNDVNELCDLIDSFSSKMTIGDAIDDTIALDFSNVNEIPKDEFIGLTSISASFKKKPLYTKIEYGKICFDEFITGMKFNPRPIFSRASDFAEQRIELVCEDFFTEESINRTSPNSWKIKHEFITVDMCLYFYTEYSQDDTQHEDYAIHRAAVSMTAAYDINKMYGYTEYSTEVFNCVNIFYVTLRNALMQD